MASCVLECAVQMTVIGVVRVGTVVPPALLLVTLLTVNVVEPVSVANPHNHALFAPVSSTGMPATVPVPNAAAKD